MENDCKDWRTWPIEKKLKLWDELSCGDKILIKQRELRLKIDHLNNLVEMLRLDIGYPSIQPDDFKKQVDAIYRVKNELDELYDIEYL